MTGIVSAVGCMPLLCRTATTIEQPVIIERQRPQQQDVPAERDAPERGPHPLQDYGARYPVRDVPPEGVIRAHGEAEKRHREVQGKERPERLRRLRESVSRAVEEADQQA